MLPEVRCVGTIFSRNNLAEKKPIKRAKSKSRSGWAAVHKNCEWDPQFTLPQPLDAWKAIELIRAHFATIEYKQALHKMSSKSYNQRQRRLNRDRNSKRNGCRDDGSRSAGERSLVWKWCKNSQEHLKSSEKCRNTHQGGKTVFSAYGQTRCMYQKEPLPNRVYV